MKVMYRKTAKGVRESSGKTRELSRDLRDVLKECSGLFSIEDKCAAAPPDEREWIAVALADLVAQGYLQDVPEAAREKEEAAEESGGLDSLDFSDAGQKNAREAEEKAARAAAEAARRQAEEQSRQDAAAKARREADEKARHEAAEKARREAEDKLRHETEAKARREAEEKAKREAAERARRDAEERQRLEAEARARRDAEERVRREAQEQARLEEEARAQAAREASAGLDQVADKLRADFASRRGQRDETTSKLIKEMEEEARRKAEEKAVREAEEKARIEAAERARREAEDKARREAEERARREAEERARIEAEERARREAEEAARRQAAEKLRLEAIELARRVAEEQARREAEERARREAEEKARREAEEKLRREAEEIARIEAEEKARVEAAERAQREAEEAEQRAREERRRLKAEKKAQEEALEKARLEQEERDREALRERMRLRSEKRRRAILPLVFGLLLPAALGLLLLHVIPFDGKRGEFEQAATELFGAPVKAGSAKFGLLAGPQWLIDDVVMGPDAHVVKIARVRLGVSLAGIFGGPLRFDSVHLERPRLAPATAFMLLHRSSAAAALHSGELLATGLELGTEKTALPPLNLRASFREGRLTRISGQGEDAEAGKLSLDMSRDELWRLTAGASQLRWMLGPDLPLSDVTLKADLGPDVLEVREFSANLFSGELAGSGRLSWRSGWRAAAKLEAKRIDPAKVAPAWIREGGIGGSAVMAADAARPGELLSRAAISGSFTIGRGLLGGVDFDKVLQNSGVGEQFRFESLRGDFSAESRRIEISDLKLSAPGLTADGSLTIDANRSATGRIGVEAISGGSRRKASLKVTGSLAAPRYQH